MLSTSGEFVEVLNFREDNEESSEETTGCKASVYAGFGKNKKKIEKTFKKVLTSVTNYATLCLQQ